MPRDKIAKQKSQRTVVIIWLASQDAAKIIRCAFCPFAFLPKKGTLDMLENPIKLIRKKLAEVEIEI